MTQVKAEAVTLLVAAETTLGTEPTSGWVQLQPNPGGITGYEPKFKTVERDPLSKYATKEKGDNVGLEASPQFVQTFNKDLIDVIATGVFRSAAKHAGATGQSLFRPTSVTSTGYTVASLGALANGLLVHAKGFTTSANNGIKVLAGTSTGTEIKTTGLTAETNPTNATVGVAGVQGGASDITINGSGHLTSTALDFTTLGLNVGQWIKIGGETAATQFATATYNGRAKITAITATLISLTRRSWTVGSLDAGTGKTIQLLFSRWYRNVSIDHADYLEPSLHAELEELGPGTAGVATYTYAKGLSLKTLELDAPLESQVLATMSFCGTDISDPEVAATRATGASTPRAPQAAALLDTSTDLARVRLATASTDAALAAEVNSWKLTIENNIKPQVIQGVFGANAMIYGKFDVNLSMEVYYTTDELPKAIRDNREIFWDACIRNHQAGVVFDLPYVAVRGGARTFAANESVMVSCDIPAFREPSTNVVASMSVFEYMPDEP